MNALVNLAPRSLDEAMRFADLLAGSELVPSQFRGKPGNVMVAVQWGAEVGLSPIQALQNIAVINGRPSIWGDAALALVRGSVLCDDVIETIEGDGDSRTATCDARRVGKAPVVRTFSVANAKKAGLWGKAGPWTQYPDRMLQQRARGFALRDAFPDVLRGVITVEEARDIPREMVNVTPVPARPMIEAIPHDPETGEIVEAGALTGPQIGGLKRRAAAAARKGTEPFRELWKELGAQERDVLRPELAAYQQTATEADTQAVPASAQRPEAEAAEPPTPPPEEPSRGDSSANGFGLPDNRTKGQIFADNVWAQLDVCKTTEAFESVLAMWQPQINNPQGPLSHAEYVALQSRIDTRKQDLAA